ncbi:hypothetical protein COOONC_02873 [Cooperia oncophora]
MEYRSISSSTSPKKLLSPWHHLLDISLILGQVRAIWKHAIVTPIPKGSGSSKVSCILSRYTSCTLLLRSEKITDQNLLDWVIKEQCIPHEQFGFLPGASTCTRLIDFTHTWIEALNLGKELDTSKAFDTVCSNRLLIKLGSVGGKGNIFQWFKAYLAK